MKVVVREAAAADLDDILDWISGDNPHAAVGMVRRILSVSTGLQFPASLTSGSQVWSRERASS
jgi:plasmid stabilization system protein ParE